MINQVKKLISEGNLYFEDGYLTSKGISESQFFNIFPIEDYSSSEFQSSSNTGTCKVDELGFYFENYHDLFKEVENCLDKFPFEEVYIVDVGFKNVTNFVRFYAGWLELLLLVSDHQYPIDHFSSSKAYILVEKNGKRTSTVFTVSPDQIPPEELEIFLDKISDPNRLLKSCLADDAHQGERLSTMKSSLAELLGVDNWTFIDLMTSADSLLSLFHTNYETYLRSFSFDEFIKNLEDDVGEFIKKVEEQIQSFYVQALAVPGAVILASALRGAEGSISLALVFSAGLALILVFMSLKSKKSFIDRVKENTLTKLSIYKDRTTDIDNTYVKETIAEKVTSAIGSVEQTSKDSKDEIDKIRDVIIALIFIYCICAIVFGRL